MKSLPNKIKNLNYINTLVKIPKYYYFNFKSFLKNKDKIISDIQKKFKNKIIVRSASFNEDNDTSNAGKFLSVPNINLEDYKKIESSIDMVFKSYGKNQKKHYVLVQEYIQNAEKVGVIFTADPRNGSPFRTINFNNSNHTELITSGKSNGQIIYYFKYTSKSKLPKKVQYIETLIKKLEAKFPKIFLDI